MVDETLPSGTVLHGRFRIERVRGSGGFGHVYLAIDLATNQQYAVKEYLVTGTSGQEQLRHEATVLSQLHHPNLPAFQDAFMERGRYYVVLNYIEGNDLTDLIRVARQRNDIVPLFRIMGWLLAICDAVLFLHSQRPPVIHRDIKPDNIRITSDGTAILVDLGNAKAAADGARTLFFIRHQGTPGYAPPEQYPGGTGTDIRSDVYALGGTLYFALTSHEPPSVSVRNESIQRGRSDLPSLQEALANNPPEESPETNAARQFRLGVTKPGKPAPRHSRHVAQLGLIPPELLNQLNRVIQRAMAMRPRDRYPSVADFANDLRKVMIALPPSTQPPGQRPVDPHSTQPDLPMLYETLQAAKEQNSSGTPDSSTSPMGNPGPSATSGPNTCPRCGASLTPHAIYCPQCGTSLNNATGASNSNANAKVNDLSAEQTMVVNQQTLSQQISLAQQPKTVSSVSKPTPSFKPSTAPQASLNGARKAGTSAQHQTIPAVQIPPPAQSKSPATPKPPATTGNTQSSSSLSFNIGATVIIFALITLVVLLSVIALVVFTHR